MSSDNRIKEIIDLLKPPPGKKPWYGGASPVGCLRGITPDEAIWRPAPSKHCIWEFALHMAYWKYAVRRKLEDSPTGAFQRSPADWPAVPGNAGDSQWKADRKLLDTEHKKIINAIQTFDIKRLDEEAPGKVKYRFIDLMYGVVQHDMYHTGQVMFLKRLINAKLPNKAL